MAQVFVSHVKEDGTLALEIAIELERQGYTTWCYEVDSIGGARYLLEMKEAIERAESIVLVLSKNCSGSTQIRYEALIAHEADRPRMPVLSGLSYEQFGVLLPEVRAAVAGSVAVVHSGGIVPLISRLRDGLAQAGVVAGSNDQAGCAERLEQLREALGRCVVAGTGDIHDYLRPERRQRRTSRSAERVRWTAEQVVKALGMERLGQLLRHLFERILGLGDGGSSKDR